MTRNHQHPTKKDCKMVSKYRLVQQSTQETSILEVVMLSQQWLLQPQDFPQASYLLLALTAMARLNLTKQHQPLMMILD